MVPNSGIAARCIDRFLRIGRYLTLSPNASTKRKRCAGQNTDPAKIIQDLSGAPAGTPFQVFYRQDMAGKWE
jgi:hypothetical protein